MITNTGDFPLTTYIGFSKLFDHYRSLVDSGNSLQRDRAKAILKIEKEYPILSSGLSSIEDINKYKEQIDLILEDVFSSPLSTNEIKAATTPFNELTFKASKRFKKILGDAGTDFVPQLLNFDEENFYIFGCSIILTVYYGYKVDFKRPFHYQIPDSTGVLRSYKVLFNADFISIERTENAKDITQEDVDELLENFNDVSVWKEKFPPKSWVFNGFIITNLIDATLDASISDFKTKLLQNESDQDGTTEDFERIFKSIFNIEDLKVGFSTFNEEDETFERILHKDLHSYILDEETVQECGDALCDASYYTLFKQKGLYIVTNTEKYHKLYPNNILYKKLLDQGVKSAILASIVSNDKVLGVLELVSSKINELNTVNANKLKDIMPFMIDSIVRSKQQFENELELIIQEECTSIHKSVHWKFKKEATRYMLSRSMGNPSYFREITFDNVYPLYGQIDVKGSSEARNEATKQDLLLQLESIGTIIKRISSLENLPIYEQFDFRINEYINELKEGLQVDSERQVLGFLRKEIIPLFKHLSKKNDNLKQLIKEYYDSIDAASGLVYKHRKDYDDSVMQINKRMASIIDTKQIEAQQMYPHYFERFKTDGVEHNLYIGEAITKNDSFHKVYLYNLRLWQLQVMCEMENDFYQLKERLPIPLNVASMILSFNSPLSLRFRMDEKRFDVDGTYNARYEVVKKRVDKANIKGTEERITQPGKITIIYSQKEDEKEYLRYISFLQSKKQLDEDVEILELEDLQGVTGLKAIRVSVLYSKDTENSSKEYYTYEDLITQLED